MSFDIFIFILAILVDLVGCQRLSRHDEDCEIEIDCTISDGFQRDVDVNSHQIIQITINSDRLLHFLCLLCVSILFVVRSCCFKKKLAQYGIPQGIPREMVPDNIHCLRLRNREERTGIVNV